MSERVEAVVAGASLAGVRLGGVSRFSAIRYALPPTGERRFSAPERAPLEGRIDACRPGPIAPQQASLLRGTIGDIDAPQSEDCLHLTVWTPATDSAGRPVLVWFHGGAWQGGGGALDWYDGATLATRGNIVVVGVNYRLGALGWLYTAGGVGNPGLLDQEMALQWVAQHIASLGGDPHKVTAVGQSAGGSCVAALLPRKPAFQRAILQSAPLGRGFRAPAVAAALGEALLDAAGAPDLEAARSIPVERLLQAQHAPQVREVQQSLADGHGLFAPVLDGSTLPLKFDRAQAAGAVDVLVGANRNEMAAFPGHAVSAESDRLGERLFGAPARQWAADAVAHGRNAWAYRFDAAANARFGACHCIELPFVFGNLDAFSSAPMLHGLERSDALRLTQEVQGAWLDFVCGRPLPWSQGPHAHAFE